VFLPVVCLDFDERLSVNPKKAAVRGRVYETVPARSDPRHTKLVPVTIASPPVSIN
jgi:hypothetical protein